MTSNIWVGMCRAVSVYSLIIEASNLSSAGGGGALINIFPYVGFYDKYMAMFKKTWYYVFIVYNIIHEFQQVWDDAVQGTRVTSVMGKWLLSFWYGVHAGLSMSLTVSCFIGWSIDWHEVEGRGSINTKVAKSKGQRLSVTVLENE